MNEKNRSGILTDIEIPQYRKWGEKTDMIRNGRKPGLIKIPRSSGLISSMTDPLLNFLFLLIKKRSYKVIITAHLRTATLFGLYRYLFRDNRQKHFVLEMMLDEERSGMKWGLKVMLQRLAFSMVDTIFVSSSAEVETYSKRLNLSRDRFKFLPFHTNIVDPKLVPPGSGFILSAGRTGRDFGVLCEAVKGLEVEVCIVADIASVKYITPPSNVRLLTDISYDSYMELLHDCSMVVVPLKDVCKSTGQVVILEAMAIGKPVVATATTGTFDYITSGMNGLLVQPDDPEALREAIIKVLKNPSMAKTLAEEAIESVNSRHTFRTYVETILLAAEGSQGLKT
jgi:glycosyltransferase involved in cell wall biosynthesis